MATVTATFRLKINQNRTIWDKNDLPWKNLAVSIVIIIIPSFCGSKTDMDFATFNTQRTVSSAKLLENYDNRAPCCVERCKICQVMTTIQCYFPPCLRPSTFRSEQNNRLASFSHYVSQALIGCRSCEQWPRCAGQKHLFHWSIFTTLSSITV